MDVGEDATVTAAGTIFGTVPYMSPEPAHGRPLDARSDIFSFGAVLYEMLLGTRAFAGEVLSAVHRDEPRPLWPDARYQRGPGATARSLREATTALEPT